MVLKRKVMSNLLFKHVFVEILMIHLRPTVGDRLPKREKMKDVLSIEKIVQSVIGLVIEIGTTDSLVI